MTKARALPALLGAALLAALVLWIGPRILARQMFLLGWTLPLLVFLGLIKHALRAASWREALRAEGVRAPFLALFQARVASQSVAYLSAMGSLIADPAKAWILRRHAPVADTIEATLVEAAAYWFTSLVVVAGGGAAALTLITARSGGAIAIALLGLTAAALFAILTARKPVLPSIATWLSRGGRASTGLLRALGKAGEMERRMRLFRVRSPGAMARVLALNSAVQAVTVAEVWAVLFTLGVSGGLLTALFVDAAVRVSKIASFYIPGRIGADEAAAAGAAASIGLAPATGLALALARRLQGLCWAAIGLIWLRLDGPSAETRRESGASEPPPRASSEFTVREGVTENASAYLSAGN